LESSIAAKNGYITRLEQVVAGKNAHISQLERLIRRQERVLATLPVRIGARLHTVFRRSRGQE
jgi:hypothetical protein